MTCIALSFKQRDERRASFSSMSKKKRNKKEGRKSKGGEERKSDAGPASFLQTGRGAVSFITKREIYIFIAAAFSLALFLSMVSGAFLFQGGDNAVYISLAKSLVQGQGFTSIYTYPADPHTKYPPFFPLMLAGVILFSGENILAMQIMIALCGALSAGAIGLLWAGRGDRLIGFITALWVGSMPFTLYYSIHVLSEIPFTAFVCLTFLFAEKAFARGGVKNAWFALAVVFMIISYFTRSAGITVMPALFAGALFIPPVRKRLKANALMAAGVFIPFAVAAAAWKLRCKILTEGEGDVYFGEFLRSDPRNLDSPMIGLQGILERMVENGGAYTRTLYDHLPWPPQLAGPSPEMSGLVILGVCALGLGLVMYRKRGAPEFFMFSYWALIMVWSFHPPRFLIPLYPFLIYYFLKGVEGMVKGVAFVTSPLKRFVYRPGPGSKPSGKRASSVMSLFRLPVATGVILALIGGAALQWNLRQSIRDMRFAETLRQAKGLKLNDYFKVVPKNKPMARMVQMSVYLRGHTEPGEVVFARKASLVALVSDRPAVGGPYYSDPGDFVKNLEDKNISYVMLDEAYAEVPKYFVPAVKGYPDRFEVFYRIPDTDSMLLEFKR